MGNFPSSCWQRNPGALSKKKKKFGSVDLGFLQKFKEKTLLIKTYKLGTQNLKEL